MVKIEGERKDIPTPALIDFLSYKDGETIKWDLLRTGQKSFLITVSKFQDEEKTDSLLTSETGVFEAKTWFHENRLPENSPEETYKKLARAGLELFKVIDNMERQLFSEPTV